MLNIIIFKDSFVASTLINSRILVSNITNSGAFQETLLGFIKPSTNKTSHNRNPKGLKQIARLRLGLTHLWFYKFKHTFPVTFCTCDTIETAAYYFFPYILSILSKTSLSISKIPLFGDHSFSDPKNNSILVASTKYISSTKYFDVPLFQNWQWSICLCSLFLVSLKAVFSFVCII